MGDFVLFLCAVLVSSLWQADGRAIVVPPGEPLIDHIEGNELRPDGKLNPDFRQELLFGHRHTALLNGSLAQQDEHLMNLFKTIDHDSDASLTSNELMLYFTNSLRRHVDDALAATKRDFVNADTDKDKLINWDEFFTFVHQRAGKTEQEISEKWRDFLNEAEKGGDKGIASFRRSFEANDIDTDEHLDEDEFQATLHPELSESSRLNLAQAILENYDMDADGVVEYGEFARILQEEGNLDNVEVKHHFGYMDSNADGLLNAMEIFEFLDPYNTANAEHESEDVFLKVDTDDDDLISVDEWKTARQYLLNSQICAPEKTYNHLRWGDL